VTELALLLLLAQAGPARVTVQSDTSCPTAAEVESRLQALLPPLAEGVAPAQAAISAEDGSLRVRLRSAEGAPLGERRLTLEASCADRANVVAVVIAAWEAQERAEHVQEPSLPRRPPAPALSAGPPPPRPPALALELWAGPALTLLPGGPRAGGTVAAGLWGQRFGARLALHGVWPLGQELPDGRARWTRSAAALELGVRAAGRLGRLDAHAGPVAGMLVAQGQSFQVDHTAAGLSPGLTAGAGWSYARGRLLLGAGLAATAWTAQRLVSAGGAYALPRLQLTVDLHAGVTF
jgi:hypothetical protein